MVVGRMSGCISLFMLELVCAFMLGTSIALAITVRRLRKVRDRCKNLEARLGMTGETQ
jgi:hypothetical protein